MANPYANRPSHAFWRDAVAGLPPEAVDPVTAVPFRISRSDAVATAGSCFAQHISRTLSASGFNYLVTEAAPEGVDAEAEGYGVFSARFGNVYTVRQLLQLFDRAYGVFRPADRVWRRPDGSFVDSFRPRVKPGGWTTAEEIEADRKTHFRHVRRMFEGCDVFVFTLGLTEGWVSVADGAVYPLAPGAVHDCDDSLYRFQNFSVGAMVQDMLTFLGRLRKVNPKARVILTVSPVPLIATAEDRHVLVSNTYSKSALRVVAEEACRAEGVAYFPSFEIITGPQARSRFFADDLRGVTAAGVAHVMAIFSRHFLLDAEAEPPSAASGSAAGGARLAKAERRLEEAVAVICDEESLVPPRS